MAISYLVRHPQVRVVGITVPATGMVTCDGGLQLLADLFTALESPSLPVACGVEPRSDGAVPFPEDWSAGVVTGSGLPHVGTPPVAPLRESAGIFTTPAAGTESKDGAWRADVTGDRGRLHRTGTGRVRVVTELDAAALDDAYAAVFEPVM